MKLRNIIIISAIVLLILVLFVLPKCGTKPDIKTVNCSNKESLADAVATSKNGTRIIVKGSCEEDNAVVVTQDNIIIDGKGGAVIDGKGKGHPVLTIRGAKNVIINDLAVKNGGHGIVATDGAKIILRNVTVEKNSVNGITISKADINRPDVIKKDFAPNQDDRTKQDLSSAFNYFNISPIKEAVADTHPCDCAGSVVDSATGIGSATVINRCMDTLDRGNTMVLCGKISSNNNLGNGMSVLGGATLIVNNSLEVSINTGGTGLYIDGASTASISSGGSVLATNNGIAGVAVIDSILNIFGTLQTDSNGSSASSSYIGYELLAMVDNEVVTESNKDNFIEDEEYGPNTGIGIFCKEPNTANTLASVNRTQPTSESEPLLNHCSP